MDYNLEALSWRQFEQMTQALALHHIGPSVSVFGDGPDGGREATWEGTVPSLGSLPEWDGYGVLQAKFHVHTGDVADNLGWLTRQVKSELNDWAKPDTKRLRKPDFLLFATNVRLSPAGKDQIKRTLTDEALRLELPLKESRVWDYDDLRAILDGAADIRSAYAALITPGDLISRLIDQADAQEQNFAEALTLHAASAFEDDTYLKLSQAGTYGDRRIAVADVFVDLPLEEPMHFSNIGTETDDPEEESNVVAALVRRFDELATTPDGDHAQKKKCVLIGGPGQGKSTVTQFLAQLYRATFLSGSTVMADADLAINVKGVLARAASINVPHPRARRWPFRIDLTDLADSLASGRSNGLLEYIANAISKSSERDVSTDRIHGWLGEFPWLLILDGLDEVPNSSNRDQVIRCVQDFNIKAVAAGGDVTILATTRPQGYSEEFSPASFKHIELASLPLKNALSYAKGFIAVRMPEGSSRAEAVYQGLVRASADESTANLFTTPLQVTILTVLVETSGQVPRDRWRLFSRYYDVINQRELEKGGELSTLLQEYESDVVFLHRHIGNLLQHRGARAGDTSATITREEFLQIIRDRLSAMDHEPSKVSFLAEEFARLVTDRLVFLAVINSERIGFEIRSLQEYMAGAYISDLPDSQIVPTIRSLSIDPYWRNVLLFAIGYIFTSKDHLKAEIPQLCEELDDDSVDGMLVVPGAQLALDILRDGATQSQPRFARRLARKASALLIGPVQERVAEFSRFADDVVSPILKEAAQSLDPTTTTGWINRTLACLAILPPGEVRDAHISSIFSLADETARKGILRILGERLESSALDALKSQLGNYSPALLLGETGRAGIRLHRHEDEILPDWFHAVLSVSSRSGDRIFVRVGSHKEARIRLSLMPIKEKLDDWIKLSELNFEHAAWRFLSKIGSFVQDPSTDALADLILGLKALDPVEREVALMGPWVLAACYEAASKYPHSYGAETFDDAADFLVAACRAGELGSAGDWERTEARYRALQGKPIRPVIGRPGTEEPKASLPIWPELADAGISLLGLNAGFTHGYATMHETAAEQAADLEELMMLADSTVGASQAAALTNYISFAATMIVNGFNPLHTTPAAALPAWARVRQHLEAEVQQLPANSPLWGRWAFIGHPEQTQREDYPILLEKLGGMKLEDARFGIVSDDLEWVKDGATYSTDGWRRYRLATSYSPSIIRKLRPHEQHFIRAARAKGGMAAELAAFLDVCNATSGALDDGSLDDLILSFFQAEEAGTGDLLEQLWMVGAIESAELAPLIRRIVHVSMNRYPIQAVRFVELLTKSSIAEV
ncbi:NACHT domain-containing protein [Arthrobacter sp. NPDC057009]|uniref:NACHT domain-containing protein n=1 Tax=Arthrobacter sp. NPDC057009 TaxID=3345996 RepID=UPI00363D52F8